MKCISALLLSIVQAQLYCASPVSDMSECECSDDMGCCVDTDKYGTLCSLKQTFYPILAAILIICFLLCFADHYFFKPI